MIEIQFISRVLDRRSRRLTNGGLVVHHGRRTAPFNDDDGAVDSQDVGSINLRSRQFEAENGGEEHQQGGKNPYQHCCRCGVIFSSSRLGT